MVVGAIDIESAVVVDGCGVGTEDTGANGIGVADAFVVGFQCLCLNLQA